MAAHTSDISAIAFSPTQRRWATSGVDEFVRIWDAHDFECVHSFRLGGVVPYHIDWSPDETRFVVANSSGAVTIWDARSGYLLRTISAHVDGVAVADWHPTLERILTASYDGTVKIWDLDKSEIAQSSDASALSCSWSHDDQYLATQWDDESLTVLDVRTGQVICKFKAPAEMHAQFDPKWSPDGKMIARAVGASRVNIWDIPSSELLTTLEHPGTEVRSVSWRCDGKQLVTINDDNYVRIWDAQSWTEALSFPTRPQPTCVALVPIEAILQSDISAISISIKRRTSCA